MKNKIIAILLFTPLLLIGLVFSLGRLYGSVSDADRIMLNHDVLNAIRVDTTQKIDYKVLPEKYTSQVIITSSDEDIVQVIKPTEKNPDWQIKALKEGEVRITAKLANSDSLAEDSVRFYAYTENTNKILTYDKNMSPQLIANDKQYGEYSFDKDFNKINATFYLRTLDLSGLTHIKDAPAQECDIYHVTSNLSVELDPYTYDYKVTIHGEKDENGESYVEFKTKKPGYSTIERYQVDIIDNGVNVYNYEDLLHCTNLSEEGEIIVLQTHLESAQNTFMNYDINNKDKVIDVNNASKFRNTELFGHVKTEDGKNIYYMDDYLNMESTYDTKYLSYINETYNLSIPTTVKVGIELKQDLYGNGYTLNMHSLTFPSGEGTQTSQGVTNIYPTARDPFQGALDFVAITFNELSDRPSSYKPIASVAGQDNIGLLVKGDNISIYNVEIKSCNNVNHLSNLEYVGTTVEVIGDNVTISNSILQNGRTVLRSFSNDNLKIENSLLRFARDFIIKVGSNTNYFSEAVGDYPSWSGDEAFDNEITLDNVYTQDSGFFSLGVDTHFNGSALIDGDPMFLSGATKLGATSKGTKINILNNTKFYDWKDITELDTSTLIQLSKGIDDSIKDLLFKNFDIAQLIRDELVGENAKFIYEIDEPVLDENGKPIINNGKPETTTVEYVHGGIAFYGGGKNYSVMTNTEEQLNNLQLNKLDKIRLTGILSSFSGSEPFKFYMYDRFANVTPVSSPNINDLREFYDENQSNFTTH